MSFSEREKREKEKEKEKEKLCNKIYKTEGKVYTIIFRNYRSRGGYYMLFKTFFKKFEKSLASLERNINIVSRNYQILDHRGKFKFQETHRC